MDLSRNTTTSTKATVAVQEAQGKCICQPHIPALPIPKGFCLAIHQESLLAIC